MFVLNVYVVHTHTWSFRRYEISDRDTDHGRVGLFGIFWIWDANCTSCDTWERNESNPISTSHTQKGRSTKQADEIDAEKRKKLQSEKFKTFQKFKIHRRFLWLFHAHVCAWEPGQHMWSILLLYRSIPGVFTAVSTAAAQQQYSSIRTQAKTLLCVIYE